MTESNSHVPCLNDKHEPNMETLEYTKFGRTTTCKKCGVKLLIYKVVNTNKDPEKAKVHKSKKERLAERHIK